MLIGYARVSTQEQETNLQIDALIRAGCTQIYQEKRSGGNLRRPELLKLLNELKPGVTVVVYKLDRIARSLRDLLYLVERIEGAGAKFHSLTEHMDTSTPSGRMIFQIIGAFAEFERALIRERVTAGLEAAVKRGAILGRARGMTPENEREAMKLWQTGKYTKTSLAEAYGVHVSSVKRAIRRNGLGQKLPKSATPRQRFPYQLVDAKRHQPGAEAAPGARTVAQDLNRRHDVRDPRATLRSF